MKRIYIIIIIILCGCSINQSGYHDLSTEIEINDTIKNYANLKTDSENQGEVFGVKIIGITKIVTETGNSYLYEAVIAPLTTMPVKIDRISLLPPDELVNYYDDNQFGPESYRSWNSIFDSASFPEMSEIKDFTAYEFQIRITDLGKDIRENAGITEDLFDEYMKQLKVKIYYNNEEKLLSVDYTDDYKTVTEDNCDSYCFVFDKNYNGSFISFIEPYR